VRTAPGSALVFATNGEPAANDGDDAGDPNRPGARVRQQTRDVRTLLELVRAL
jgi:hypothetical protein